MDNCEKKEKKKPEIVKFYKDLHVQNDSLFLYLIYVQANQLTML